MTLSTAAQTAQYVAPFSNAPADYEVTHVSMDSDAQDFAIDAEADGFDGVEPQHPSDSFYMTNYQKGCDLRTASFDDEF